MMMLRHWRHVVMILWIVRASLAFMSPVPHGIMMAQRSSRIEKTLHIRIAKDTIAPRARGHVFLPPDDFITRLYGEWTMWHSTAPQFDTPNAVLIWLYPPSRIEICWRKTMGPFLYEDRWIGDLFIWGMTECDSVEANVCNNRVHVEFDQGFRRVLSVCGIGLDDVLQMPRSKTGQVLTMDLQNIGKDDMFLMSSRHSYHLVRSMRLNEPTINIPLSTLVATQLAGMLVTHIFQEVVKHCPWW